MANSPFYKGWLHDVANGRLAALYNGTEVFDFDANDMAVASGITLDLSNATVTLPTRTANFDLMHNVYSNAGASLLGAETAGTFNYAVGTNQFLIQGEVTNNETETSVGAWRFQLPENYVSGGTITINAGVDIIGAGTAGASTIDFTAFLQNATSGAVGSDLVSTAAQSISTTAAIHSFTVTPTGLVAGDILVGKMTMVVIESAASNITGEIYSLYATVQVNK